MSYKDTLNLPQSEFAMKANLPQNEPKYLKLWEEKNLYGLIREKNKGKPKYILHDGPPYANGDIHIGHALNKTLKDIIIKFKTMQGFDSPYVPGWDCHGLPVEHQLLKELGITKHQIDQVAFRQKAHNYAMSYVRIQREQFKRLGVLAEWENPYLTLTTDYEEAILKSFLELANKGYIYRKHKPVNWCYECETALAEAEVEYEDHQSPSIYVKFAAKNSQEVLKHLGQQDNLGPVYFIIWTTTPWTLVSNVAVALHPAMDYLLLKQKDGGIFVVAQALKDKVKEALGEKLSVDNLIATIKGVKFEGLICRHPFISRDSKVVLADYVSSQDGTGLVHTAPGHGQEDYLTGLKYNLDIIMPVDEKGKFDGTVQEFNGLNVHQANPQIVNRLIKDGNLLNKAGDTVAHSYPHCWRCKRPIIFRATEQWFLSIDHQKLRQRVLKEIDKVNWIPKVGKDRIAAMFALRPDWCLSRQRYWGVPIPAIKCFKCKKEMIDAKVVENFLKFVAKEGTDSWFKRDIKELINKDTVCHYCGASEFEKGKDILDGWFDSGVSSQAVLKKRPYLAFPAQLYLEGSDQHRGWFQSSLIPAMAIDEASPFKNVLTHGFVVDGEGKKMSKSLGNVVSPHEVIRHAGADIIRLWVASCDYSDDIRVSDEILQRLSEAYRKFRNTARYLLGNLYDFDTKDSVKFEELLEIDRWAMSKLYGMIKEAQAAYEEFAFYKVYQLIYKFCIVDMSSFYLDILKDRLYTYSANSRERRSAQTVLYEVLVNLTKVAAPILSFTCEEIWQLKFTALAQSVHLADWPSLENKYIDLGLEEKWRKIFAIRDRVLKAIEEERSSGKIHSSLEAKVKISTTNKEEYALLDSQIESLPFIFIVSSVELAPSKDCVEILKADGQKCPRCWNYFNESSSTQEVCPRCAAALENHKNRQGGT